MFTAIASPYLVPFDGGFRRGQVSTTPPGDPGKKEYKRLLAGLTEELDDLQRRLYAADSYALLLIFQGMDASGKDSTVRAVMSGVNPAGCEVHAFKQPSREELGHDFLWRTTVRLPERGRIGIFNRSYYEEVLAVRVHKALLAAQRLPGGIGHKGLWRERLESINDHERHLARNGTVILKFWLNVSKKEQRKRFLSRIDVPDKNWKFSEADVREREYWRDYMEAYQQALAATSREWAPWYAVPADDKAFMHYCVADLIVRSLRSLDLSYPRAGAGQEKRLQKMRKLLEKEG